MERLKGFDWDAGNAGKCCQHGVSLAEIEALFHGDMHVFPDVKHSHTEMRYFGIGVTQVGRHVFVAFTLRNKLRDRYIPPISARYMHSKEVRHYEAEIARRQN